MLNSDEIWSRVDELSEDFCGLSDRVWETPELCFKEVRSAAEHMAMLEKHGFKAEAGVAGMPTAIMAEAGSEGPVIAILGEYDALPGLSQVHGIAERQEVEKGGSGHGCGHNLLGAGSMLAATAVKDWLKERGIKGRVALLRLSGRRRWLCQGLHGARGNVRRC